MAASSSSAAELPHVGFVQLFRDESGSQRLHHTLSKEEVPMPADDHEKWVLSFDEGSGFAFVSKGGSSRWASSLFNVKIYQEGLQLIKKVGEQRVVLDSGEFE